MVRRPSANNGGRVVNADLKGLMRQMENECFGIIQKIHAVRQQLV